MTGADVLVPFFAGLLLSLISTLITSATGSDS